MAFQSKVTCPIENCDYWVCFGGYLNDFTYAFKRHVETDHPELDSFDRRRTGGIIDRWIGDLVVESQKAEA